MVFTNAAVPLRAIRDKSKQTQIEMAVELGCHVQFVSNWERGKCLPPTPVMKRLYNNMTAKEKKYFDKCVGADYTNAFKRRIK